MKQSNGQEKQLAHSILWAALMIATALVMKGDENLTILLIIMISSWFCSFILLTGSQENSGFAAERACIHRFFGRNDKTTSEEH